jgi:hypothetical protein
MTRMGIEMFIARWHISDTLDSVTTRLQCLSMPIAASMSSSQLMKTMTRPINRDKLHRVVTASYHRRDVS